ncbi:hypothetical protein FA95DRAFT_914792 [Auriscalpium vulgare]|uniref:Uncharacterized protein n=1 Tax=Auriscalpium vulgare TaxID=40419 RepID=A0ACB8R8F1_9AGAM|nr:hypothetical protein FA95DRAFT_914792 [Auriscalpium vulgare]
MHTAGECTRSCTIPAIAKPDSGARQCQCTTTAARAADIICHSAGRVVARCTHRGHGSNITDLGSKERKRHRYARRTGSARRVLTVSVTAAYSFTGRDGTAHPRPHATRHAQAGSGAAASPGSPGSPDILPTLPASHASHGASPGADETRRDETRRTLLGVAWRSARTYVRVCTSMMATAREGQGARDARRLTYPPIPTPWPHRCHVCMHVSKYRARWRLPSTLPSLSVPRSLDPHPRGLRDAHPHPGRTGMTHLRLRGAGRAQMTVAVICILASCCAGHI